MREIKFRAKPVYRGGKQTPWVYGTFKYLWQNRITPGATDTGRHEQRWDKGIIIGEWGDETEVLCETVGQWTGLTDKQGRPIYEGDIVRWQKDSRRYVVEFRRGMFYAAVSRFNPGIHGGFPLWVLCEEEQHCTIEGNIYDRSATQGDACQSKNDD